LRRRAEIKAKYDGVLQPVMPKSKTADLVSKVFKALSQKKVMIPSSKFVSYVSPAHASVTRCGFVLCIRPLTFPLCSAKGARAVRCSLKANQGYLFLFESSFFFVPKPAAYLRMLYCHRHVRCVCIDWVVSPSFVVC
jgi:hypothetical protein